MNSLQTQNPIALSLLINEDIYRIPEPAENIDLAVAGDTENVVVESHENKVLITEKLPIVVLSEPIIVKPAYKYIGENLKSILILVNELDSEILKTEDLLALNKMLAARKLEQKDVAILNIHKNTHLTFQELKDFFGFNKLLLFGINPTDLGISGMVANQIRTFQNTQFLVNWHIKQMQTDEKKKLTFWTEMKKLI